MFPRMTLYHRVALYYRVGLDGIKGKKGLWDEVLDINGEREALGIHLSVFLLKTQCFQTLDAFIIVVSPLRRTVTPKTGSQTNFFHLSYFCEMFSHINEEST